MKIIESFKKITKQQILRRYSGEQGVAYIPAYLKDDGDIIFLSPEVSAEKAWNQINHSLVIEALVVKVKITGKDFLEDKGWRKNKQK